LKIESDFRRENKKSKRKQRDSETTPGGEVNFPRIRASNDGFVGKRAIRWGQTGFLRTKLDGYRAIAVIDSTGKARLWSRNRLPLEPKFPMVLDAVDQLKTALNDRGWRNRSARSEGHTRFQFLQQWEKRPAAPIVYFLFDLLWSDGRRIYGQDSLAAT